MWLGKFHSTLQSRQTFNQIHCVITVILPQTVTELCISMPATPVLRTFVQYLTAFCSRPETTSPYVIYGKFVRSIVSDKLVKCRDPSLNQSREIPPQAFGSMIFGRFSNVDNFQPEVDSDVISGVVVDPAG